MNISFEIPEYITEQLGTNGADLSRHARSLFLLGLYREGRISHAWLRDELGLSYFETESFLHQHGIAQDIDPEEFEAERLRLSRQLKP